MGKRIRVQMINVLSGLTSQNTSEQKDSFDKLQTLLKDEEQYVKEYIHNIFVRDLRFIYARREMNNRFIEVYIGNYVNVKNDDVFLTVSVSILPEVNEDFSNFSKNIMSSIESFIKNRGLTSVIDSVAVNGVLQEF